ncbi:hypothetical protein L1987_70946 [Smallanthus sonchifolius]|uniref:Uncharacterized protein n=1 Tax=Smallanthus sonchifolius TaxID=185202 RepID=A0ACB9ASE2_9ASTR|nr:hypothetical protein L1987_70946 [Smallanthus sonchifolius]
MPGFDPEIGKLAQRVLINPRKIDYHTGVFATKITPAKDGKPVTIELIDAKTKEPKRYIGGGFDHTQVKVDAALIATGRAPFTQGLGLENATSAQGISVSGKDHVLNHLSIPAACFTHPEISMVGPKQEKKQRKKDSKSVLPRLALRLTQLAENEGEGLAKHRLRFSDLQYSSSSHPALHLDRLGQITPSPFKLRSATNLQIMLDEEESFAGKDLSSFSLSGCKFAQAVLFFCLQLIYRPDNGEILGVHIFGMHSPDLIHEASNAIALGTCIQDIKYAVHAHPTLSEVIDELFKSAKVKNEAPRAVTEPVAV